MLGGEYDFIHLWIGAKFLTFQGLTFVEPLTIFRQRVGALGAVDLLNDSIGRW